MDQLFGELEGVYDRLGTSKGKWGWEVIQSSLHENPSRSFHETLKNQRKLKELWRLSPGSY